MLLRALLLLLVVVVASVAATVYFGNEVLVALTALLTQAKVVAKKAMQIELPALLSWLKHELALFLRIELVKKWAMTTALPLLVGTAVLRRLKAFAARYTAGVRRHYAALLDGYRGLDRYVRVIAALILLAALLGLSVTSIGLWLVLFSVKIPLWLAASVASLAQMLWLGVQKTAFKTLAFLQLGLAWRVLMRRLPPDYVARKRRLDFRLARMVVRRRRLTLRQLGEQKDGLALRLAVLRARWRRRRPG